MSSSEIKNLKSRIKKIEARNKSVEADKAWETSFTRRLFIALFTYIILTTYMWAIRVPAPLLNAIVPTIGFLLSTLTLPLIKKIWLKNRQ